MSENNDDLFKQDNETDLQATVEDAFRISLTAAIMSEFPVASILAIFKAHKGKKLVAEVDEISEKTGDRCGVKRILAKIFSIYGFINGIICTAIYAELGVCISIYVIIMFLFFLGSMINNAGTLVLP